MDVAEWAGSARLVLVDGVPLLHPEAQVFQAMLEGWRNQLLARNLAAVDGPGPGGSRCGRSPRHADRSRGSGRRSWPMSGSPICARSGTAARSTVRGYQVAVRGFCDYLDRPCLRVGRRVRAAGSGPTRSR